jgi:ATP-dependent Clp protease protease subunit
MEAVLAKHSGRDEEQIRRDIERDKFLTAFEAKEYGLVDDVLTMLKRQPDVVSS